MSLDAGTLQKLMAFADGELEGDDRKAIEDLVRSNQDAARIVQELGVLGDCLRVVGTEQSDRAAADGIADAVMGRIAAEREPRGKVIDLVSRRRRTYGTVAALVAAAAAVALVARGPEEEPRAEIPVAPAPMLTAEKRVEPTPAPPTTVASAATEPAPAPSNVSVIVVPSEGETASSIVIWLGEESASGGPVK